MASQPRLIQEEDRMKAREAIDSELHGLQTVTLASMRQMTAQSLSILPGPTLVKDGTTRLVVIIPYYDYLKMVRDISQWRVLLEKLQGKLKRTSSEKKEAQAS